MLGLVFLLVVSDEIEVNLHHERSRKSSQWDATHLAMLDTNLKQKGACLWSLSDVSRPLPDARDGSPQASEQAAASVNFLRKNFPSIPNNQ